MSLNACRWNPRVAGRIAQACAVACTAILGFGCEGNGGRASPQPLTAENFASRNGVSIEERTAGQPVDRGGVLPGYDSESTRLRTPAQPSAEPSPSQRTIRPAVSAGIPELSPVVTSTTQPASTQPLKIDVAAGPATQPTTKPAVADGVWLNVGSVVMKVNSQPIYSHKVLQALERPLSAEARRNDVVKFRAIATEMLGRQVQAMKADELEVAAADRSLSAADKSIADALTMQWRSKQITAAGGSVELARRRARDEGWDFEDLVAQQRRVHLVRLFYQKWVYGLAAASANEIREYYDRNRDKEFTVHGKAKFLVIKIDPRDRQFISKDDAVAFAEKVRERALKEDFVTLANEVMKDGSGGKVGTANNDYWILTGNYRFEGVEKAATALKPGSVTPVVQEEGFLFIAKLEQLQEAKVKSFDDPEVQEAISTKLRGQQIQAIREKHRRKLERDAVTQVNERQFEEMLETVMRRYPEWAGQKASATP